MNIASILVVIFFVYYSIMLYGYLLPSKRKVLEDANLKMEELRKIPIKTVEEQKAFIDVRYPKGKFKFKKEMIPSVLINMGCFIILFQFYSIQLLNLGWNIKLWQAILFVMFMPIIINIVLRKFNLQRNDISVFFK